MRPGIVLPSSGSGVGLAFAANAPVAADQPTDVGLPADAANIGPYRFGSVVAGATIRSRADLDQRFFYRLIFANGRLDLRAHCADGGGATFLMKRNISSRARRWQASKGTKRAREGYRLVFHAWVSTRLAHIAKKTSGPAWASIKRRDGP